MGFNTEGLSGWPAPETLRTSGKALQDSGKKLSDGVGECVNGWVPVETHYTEGAGKEKIYAAMTMPLAHGTAVEMATKSAKGYIDTFADEVDGLKTRRTTVQEKMGTFNDNESSDDESKKNPEFGMGSEAAIQSEIDGIVEDLISAADKCAQDINKVDVTEPWFVDLITSKEAGLITALGTNALTLSQFEHVTVTKVKPVTLYFPQWKRTEIFVPTRVLMTPNGTYIQMTRLVQDEFRLIPVQGTLERSWLEKKWLNLKPEPSEFFFKHSEKYRAFVNAHPDRFAPPTQGKPSWWRGDLKLSNLVDDFNKAKGWTKFAKGAGPIVAIAAAGLTYADEYKDAKEELAKEHPDWSEEQIHNRAIEEAAVKGTTKVGLDIGAGMAGAYVGTLIGGPLGTVIGFGVGMGASWLMDELGIKDAAADFAQDTVDVVTDVAEDVGGAISDGWNSVFG